MKKTIFIFLIAASALLALMAFFAFNDSVTVLNPQGLIAREQRNIFGFIVLLSLVVVIPVFVLLFAISWHFRADNKKARYRPDWDSNHWLEAVWWGIPIAIIATLAVVTWQTSHSLDPYRPINSEKQPLTVQVVALQWKWLFLYPNQQVASVNELVIPEQVPIAFKLTSDAPMNSFWIPALGGQIYTMSGMSTNLHLMSDKIGTYEGKSANISGEGFASMRFKVRSVSSSDFEDWVTSSKDKPSMNDAMYVELSSPSIEQGVELYTLPDSSLYDRIIMQYMAPNKSLKDGHDQQMMMGGV